MERLIWRLGVPPRKVIEILDYYHNSETLFELVQLHPKLKEKAQRALYETWKTLMWNGELFNNLPVRAVSRTQTGKKCSNTFAERNEKTPSHP